MSGRLVILPKKSWHVWNRENVEKVKRDERLDREKKEKEETRARQLLQEQQLSILQKQATQPLDVSENEGETSLVLHQDPPHFRLFEDLEKKLVSSVVNSGNDEYRKEKEEEELLKKRREGCAPWALGEGAAEKSKVKPWYHYAPSDKLPGVNLLGKQLLGEEAQLAIERESLRKHKADPMAQLLKDVIEEKSATPIENKSFPTQPIINISNLWGLPPQEGTIANNDIITIKTKKAKHHSSKHKEKEKKKKKEKKKEKKDRSASHEDVKPSNKQNNHSNNESSSSLEAIEEDTIAVLRKRRLERERDERKKASKILEAVDIYGYGTPLSSGSRQQESSFLGQQFHPNLAKKKY